MTMTDEQIEATMALADSMRINRTSRRAAGGGAWVLGTIGGLEFEALVFPEHAECESYELERSKISKLWIGGAGRETLYCWDRGLGVGPATPHVQAIVDLLADGLAETIYGS